MADLLLLWHMHQPRYVHPETGEPALPWVRLHAASGYLDMARALERRPGARVTVNFVPSLIEQLEALVAGTRDPLERIAEKHADVLDEDERKLVLARSFSVRWDKMIAPRARYAELLSKRGEDGGPEGVAHAATRFSPGELRDVQCLFLLAWLGFAARQDDPAIGALDAKGRDFSEDDKAFLVAAVRGAAGRVLPAWRALAARGQVELATSPYYHPIVPLLCDSDAARRARPRDRLPPRFSWPGDARAQIQLAQEAHRRVFGAPAAGMWPPEGSLSPEALACYAEAGVRWLAGDEETLARSLEQARGAHGDGGAWHEPGAPRRRLWRHHGVVLAFRDRELSDRIGFVYSGWEGKRAADDVIARLLAARDHLGAAAGDHCLTIILDGENPWEHYPDLGSGFLHQLYGSLARTPGLRPVRFCDHRRSFDRAAPLAHVVAGSWIEANFDTWIGVREKNQAWRLLSAARRELAQKAPDKHPSDEIYRAEGSDWFWWLGPGHETPYEASYENLFRLNLRIGLEKCGVAPPALLEAAAPLLSNPLSQQPLHLSSPRIDGHKGRYYDWIAAGFHRASEGSLHRASRHLEILRFVFDLEHLHLRVEGDLRPLFEEAAGAALAIEFKRPRPLRALLRRSGCVEVDAQGRESPFHGQAALESVAEFRFSLSALGARPGELVEFTATLLSGELVLDRLPQAGGVLTVSPGADFGQENWSV
jgi:alpha-amylase/alpha-mannosidase (GH57 family)